MADPTFRWRCQNCKNVSTGADLLRAPSPFDPEDELVGCQRCKSSEGFDLLCDAPGCEKVASCGGPGNGGEYRHTCFDHSWLAAEKGAPRG